MRKTGERRKGGVEEFHSLQISAGMFCVADNVAISCIEILPSFGRSFLKPFTRRSLNLLSIAFVIVVVSVPVQNILPVLFMKKQPS